MLRCPSGPDGLVHPAAQVTTGSQSSNAQPQLQQRYPRYIIQRSDVLLLTFRSYP
jgi:hypothetical protein